MAKPTDCLAVLCACIATAPAQAQTASTPAAPGSPTELPSVVVTGNPLGSELFELATPISVLGGRDLFQQRRSTLGEMVNGLPGVHSSYFGPNASRPVIRGLDGDRIRILQNGNGMLDASSTSPDHAVAVDPLVVDRVEVVRGPAALLYGGNAMGGVVNVIDNRIPQTALHGVTGRAEFRHGGAERDKGTGAVFEAGNGRFALHADAYTRDTDDLAIPGFARSARRRAADPLPAAREATGRLPNSASRSDGGSLGAAYTFSSGYLGASVTNFSSAYGTVAEPTVTIDMQSTQWNVAGEKRDVGTWITGVKFRLGHTDYDHVEKNAGVPGTTFRNRGNEARLEALHGRLGPFSGAFGIQFTRFDFSALGAEAFVPGSVTDARGFFLYEEAALGPLKITLGARHERNDVSSAGGGPNDPGTGRPRFGTAADRTFSNNSGSVGAVYPLTSVLSLAASGSYTERAPTFYELFANGPHAATGVYEIGNRAFGKETSRAFDLALRANAGPHSGSISMFRSEARSFLTLFGSGNRRGTDGELNPVDVDGNNVADVSGANILPEQVYRAVPARFSGFEVDGKVRVYERSATVDLLLKADQVRATDESTGRPLPRIAPRRYGVGLAYQRDRVGARVDAMYVEKQQRVAASELPTDGYTMVNATLSYRLKLQGLDLEAFVRGTNLLNEEARNHVSFVKDIAPLGRRAALFGVRGRF